MSAINPSGYGRQDVSTFTQQWARPATGVTSTVQTSGVAMPTEVVPSAGGNPTFPWLGLVIALVALRAIAHLRKD